MTPLARNRTRVAAVLVGLVAALAPMALFAYESGSPLIGGGRVIAQATATAAPKAATPTATTAAPKATAAATAVAPKTGTAGTLGEVEGAGVTAALIVLAFGVVIGARVLATRRA